MSFGKVFMYSTIYNFYTSLHTKGTHRERENVQGLAMQVEHV
jgi:hypothetical protein